MADTKEILKEKFQKLPPDVRDAILSVDLNKKLSEISKKHALRIDQMTALENETLFVMMGIEPPGKYIINLQGELGIEEIPARKIAEDINAYVFRPIKESLKRIHHVEEEVAEQPIQPVPPLKPPQSVEQKTESRGEEHGELNTTRDLKPEHEETPPLIEHDRFHDENPLDKTPENLPTGKPENLPTGKPERAPLREPVFTSVPKEGGGDRAREKLLHEIEGHANAVRERPTPNNQRPVGNIVEEKLRGTFKIPPKESVHEEAPAEKTKPLNSPIEKLKPQSGTDPYREPIE